MSEKTPTTLTNTVPSNVTVPASGAKKEPRKLSDSIASKFKLAAGFEASRVMFPGGTVIDLSTGSADEVDAILASGVKIPHIVAK
jgi:hypothetical protein